MITQQPLEIVTERDIDILILEELIARESFARTFLPKLTPSLSGQWKILGAWHSISDPTLGESDLVTLCELSGGKRHAFLIENKIDAPPQPEQSARYRQRGEMGLVNGDWDSFTTCLIAPEKYLTGIDDAQRYEARLSYEWIAENLGPGDNERVNFRRRMVLQAIEQNRRGYSPKHDERVTAFWKAYWSVLCEHFPELDMTEPISKPVGADWIEAHAKFMRGGIKVVHKLATGTVDLQLLMPSDQLDSFSVTIGDRLHDDMTVVATGKSCSVRMSVPQVDRFKDFDSQREECLEGMRAAYRLACVSSGLTAEVK